MKQLQIFQSSPRYSGITTLFSPKLYATFFGGGGQINTFLKSNTRILALLLLSQTLFGQGFAVPWFIKDCSYEMAPPAAVGGFTLCQQLGNANIDININVPDLDENNLSVTLASDVDWGTTTGVVSNQNIRINDILYIDVPMTFFNCTFSFGPNSIIRTSEGNYFAAFFSQFFCCNNMWDGIEAKDGGQVALWGCQIEDARIALQIDDDVQTSTVLGNNFNRNHISITNGSFQAGGDGTLNFYYFANNTFQCTTPTNLPDVLGVNFPYAHIVLDRCASSLVAPETARNVFRHANIGILAEDADLTVQHADFNHLRFLEFTGAITTASGNEYGGSHIRVTECNFDNNLESAVFAIRSDVEVTLCEIEGRYTWAVLSADNTSSEEVKVSDNIINLIPTNADHAVFVERPVAWGSQNKHLEVNDNIITWDGIIPSSANFREVIGIDVFSPRMAHVSDQAEIIGNQLTFNGPDENGTPNSIVTEAIRIETPEEFDNTKVLTNTITVDKALMDYGIFFNNQFGANNEISHNTLEEELEETAGFANTLEGIFVFNATTGITMCDNSVTGSGIGIHFLADNGMTDFRSNNFGIHEDGLFIENYLDPTTNPPTFVESVIGDQVRHGNTWLTSSGAYSNKAGRCEGSAGLSEFIIENQYTPGTAFFPSLGLIVPNSGWFKNEGSTSDWCVPAPPTPTGPRLSDKDIETAGGTGSIATANATSQWEARRLLLDKLLRYPALASENQTIAQFYSGWINSSPGLYAQVENQIREAYAIDPADQAEMDGYKADRRTLRDQLVAIDLSVTEPEDMSDIDPATVADKEALLQELSQVRQDEAALKTAIRQKQEDALSQALTDVAQLPSDSVYEANRKLFYQLSIQRFLNGELSQQEETQLQNLTAGGQSNTGLAPFEARILLPKCSGSGAISRDNRPGRASRQIAEKHTLNLQIAPNPAGDAFTVTLDTDEPAALTLTDLTGRTLLSAGGQGRIRLDTRSLAGGVYLLTCRTASGKSTNHKVIVQH